MEQENKGGSPDEYEVIDLSEILDEERSYDEEPDRSRSGSGSESRLYNFLINHSGGVIKDEKQAQAVLILLIIVLNVVTFSLLTNN